jgi:hypothetical protein
MGMLEEKFDLETLKDLKLKLNEIQIWSTIERSDDHELHLMIDGLCRVAHMYNMIITQQVKDGYITIADPQSYIEGKLGTPYKIYKREKSKRKPMT